MAWLHRLCGAGSRTSARFSQRDGNKASSHPAILAAISSALLVLAAGCGNQYRPVITPITPVGPASQPEAYITLVSQPNFVLGTGANPCAGGSYSTPSVITLLDFAGDSILDQAQGGNGPLTFSLDSNGAQVFAPNCDGTITTSNNGVGAILTKNIETSTLLPGANPTNTLRAGTSLYVTETGQTSDCQATNCVAQLTGTPVSLKQEIPVAPSLINLAGVNSGERIYAISQGNSGAGPQPKWGDCSTPASVTATGEADAIETVNNTISARLPLGVCPVYGFMTPDSLRTFIMNRGSNNITVINSQLDALDTTNPNLGPNATIPVGAGPVYADYYQNGQLLVTANYDSNSISIIDVSLDVYGNDSATFGTVLKTIDLSTGPGCPTGADTMCMHPVEVAILQDGSRVYVANQGDIANGVSGSISVVNLSTYAIEKTIPLPASPAVNPHAIGAVYNYPYGKVYVASQNSPYLTIIRTDTDTISDTPEMQGNIVEMRINSQYPGLTFGGMYNYQIESRSVGSGAP